MNLETKSTFQNELTTLRTEVERLTALQEITKLLNREPDPDRMLSLIMDYAVSLTGAERGFLLLTENDLEDGSQLDFQAIRSRVHHPLTT